jgi:hypothetical protein
MHEKERERERERVSLLMSSHVNTFIFKRGRCRIIDLQMKVGGGVDKFCFRNDMHFLASPATDYSFQGTDPITDQMPCSSLYSTD